MALQRPEGMIKEEQTGRMNSQLGSCCGSSRKAVQRGIGSRARRRVPEPDESPNRERGGQRMLRSQWCLSGLAKGKARVMPVRMENHLKGTSKTWSSILAETFRWAHKLGYSTLFF